VNAREAAAELVRRDPAFAVVVAARGVLPPSRNSPVADRFPFLLRTVSYQLLAGAAAETIHTRVLTLVGEPTPDRVLAVGAPGLRTAGLSTTKAETMVRLAEATLAGSLRPERHGRLGDAEVTAEITALKGLGTWSAHMYLMNCLGRPDVWPSGDYGVRVGWSMLHDLDETISERSLRHDGEHLSGLRSLAARYCWAEIDRRRGK
jgi:3-methyladenine DNA glycosylase/8-oxoguanine DNA glycosylase